MPGGADDDAGVNGSGTRCPRTSDTPTPAPGALDTCPDDAPGVRLLAHRGSPGTTFVENTLPAMRACFEAGADGLEVDLRLSADGVLAVCHDVDLSRLTGLPTEVSGTSFAELRASCAGRGVPLARAEEVLAVAAGRPVALELKHAPPGRTPETATAVVSLLQEQSALGVPLDVTVSSFSPALVDAVRAQAPAGLGIRTALLGDQGEKPTAVLRRAVDAGHDEIHPHVAALLAEPHAVGLAHSLGARVVPWTVNRSRDLRRLAALGVDAMITDRPSAARQALAARRATA